MDPQDDTADQPPEMKAVWSTTADDDKETIRDRVEKLLTVCRELARQIPGDPPEKADLKNDVLRRIGDPARKTRQGLFGRLDAWMAKLTEAEQCVTVAESSETAEKLGASLDDPSMKDIGIEAAKDSVIRIKDDFLDLKDEVIGIAKSVHAALRNAS